MSSSLHNYEFVAEPCRNFCIFASAIFLDPVDNREKVVLSNYSDGSTGLIIIIDPETGSHETIKLPDDEGAWAIINYKNEKLVVGTCSKYGYVHTLDLKGRKWLKSLRDENERYIWNMALGSDGMIYGGTWPGCVLLQYNPESHTLKNIGKLTDYPGNMYCRPVNGDVPGYVILSTGYDVKQVILWEIATGEKRMLGKPGSSLAEVTGEYICLDTGSGLEYYSRDSFEHVKSSQYIQKSFFGKWADSSVKYVGMLSSGRIAGVRGQEYFIAEDADSVPEFRRIPGDAPATSIMTIINGDDGCIWGSTALGQTIFKYDPVTGGYWNSPQVCNNGGEVYGMRFAEGRLYLSSYVGGDHVVYEPGKPWDQYHNINPKTLQTAAPDLIRPTGKSIIGPDGNFWTGWSAKYGTYGGGLTRIDVKTNEMTCWYDPVPKQQIAGLTCDDRVIYFTTNGEASGLEDKVEPFSLCVWELEGKISWQQVFESGVNLGVILAVDGYLLVTAGDSIWIYETASMSVLHKVPAGARCTCFLKLPDGKVAAFCGDMLYEIEPGTGKCEAVMKLPGVVGGGGVGAAVIAADGKIYFTHEAKMYKWNRME